MRIIVVNSFFPPLATGSAHFSLDMAREYVNQNHDVTVISSRPHGSADYENMGGIHVYRLPTRWVKLGSLSFNYSLPFTLRRRNLKKIREIFDSFEPQVIHQNGQFFDLTLITSVFALKRKIPRVLTVHTPLTHTNRYARWLISAIDRFFLGPFARMGKYQIFGVDKFTIDLCNKRYFRGENKVGFIPATLDPDIFVGGDRSLIRSKLGLDNKKVILSFGHVIPIRNRIALIHALPEILKHIPNAQVIIVGEVFDNQFLKLASELNVRERVTVVGRVPHNDVPDYLAAADVECHDVNSHGLGITTFEVMAAGIPVVASVEEDVFPNIQLNNWPAINIQSHLTPTQLATEIVKTLKLSERDLQNTVTQQRDFVLQHFKSSVVAKQYLDVCHSLISPMGH